MIWPDLKITDWLLLAVIMLVGNLLFHCLELLLKGVPYAHGKDHQRGRHTCSSNSSTHATASEASRADSRPDGSHQTTSVDSDKTVSQVSKSLIVGYKSLQVSPENFLFSGHDGKPWLGIPPQRTAECSLHDAPRRSCDCGIYIAHSKDYIKRYAGILVGVRGWGHSIIGTEADRVEHAVVDAIFPRMCNLCQCRAVLLQNGVEYCGNHVDLGRLCTSLQELGVALGVAVHYNLPIDSCNQCISLSGKVIGQVPKQMDSPTEESDSTRVFQV